jgi:iron(II)-dependent oxidoreductase
MAASAVKTSPLSPDAERVMRTLDDVRAATLRLVSHLDEEELTRVHSSLMSPLVWDLAHIAAYEDLWLAHRHGGLELLRPDLAKLYDAFETPRAIRGEIEALGPEQAREYLRAVRDRTALALAERGAGDGVICELVIRHELQHCETMRQTLAIAGLLPPGEPTLAAIPEPQAFLEVPAGEFSMGAAAEGFAYDNERPRHALALGAFAIAHHPACNAELLEFRDEGGYERGEWWSPEGRSWLAEEPRSIDPSIEGGDPLAPACHVSWFEADAFARSRGASLPSEEQWERAASAAGELGLAGIGAVWEWTSSEFDGYPGFRAYPYREYSEVFFRRGYRVLRGGSWATHPRVASTTFRNWDLPQRRQIFAGVRLTREA